MTSLNLIPWYKAALSVIEESSDLLPPDVTQLLETLAESTDDSSAQYSFAQQVAKIYTTASGPRAPVVRALLPAVLPSHADKIFELGEDCSHKAAIAMVIAAVLNETKNPQQYEAKLAQLRSAVSDPSHSLLLPLDPNTTGHSSSSSSSASSTSLSPSAAAIPSVPPSSDPAVAHLSKQVAQLSLLLTQMMTSSQKPTLAALPSAVLDDCFWREKDAIKTTWRDSNNFSSLTKGLLSDLKETVISETYQLGFLAQTDALIALRNRLIKTQNPELALVAEEILEEQFHFLQRHAEAISHYVGYNDSRTKETDKLSKRFPKAYYRALTSHKGNFDDPSLKECRKSVQSKAGKRFSFSRPPSRNSFRKGGTPLRNKPSASTSHSSKSKSRSTSKEKTPQ